MSAFLSCSGPDSGPAGVLFEHSRNQHGLVLVVLQHVLVCSVDDGEHVGWHFDLPLATEHADAAVIVDGKATVRVDSDTEQTRVGLKGDNVGFVIFVGCRLVCFL